LVKLKLQPMAKDRKTDLGRLKGAARFERPAAIEGPPPIPAITSSPRAPERLIARAGGWQSPPAADEKIARP
jgi:hypothetical protein